MLRPVAKKSLAAEVFEQLREHIVSGGVKPGETLPSERVLSEMLQVNRGAVREGLKRLEQAGLVAVQHGGSTQVLDYRSSGGLELLGALVVRGGQVDTRVARSILELRASLGPEVARACARRRGAGELGAIVLEMQAKQGDLRALQGLAMRFWSEVVKGADGLAWQLAFSSLEKSYGLVQEHLTQLLADELSATSEYAALARAIERGSVEAAGKHASAIVAHGTAAVAKVLAALDKKGGKR